MCTTGPPRFVLEDLPLDEHLIASIASSFAEANIDNVLWGDCLLTIFGVPSGLDDVAFVVPDETITTAYSILMKLGFRECKIYPECRTMATVGFAATPFAHAHLDATRFIGLYKQSETLWNIPSLKGGHSENNPKPDIITANDPCLPGPRLGRGRGALLRALQPVHIPSAHRLTEAYILLCLRDFGVPLEFFWRSMLTYVVEFLLEDGILDTRDLQPHHGRFIQLFANPKGMGVGEIFQDLRSESGALNEK